LPAGLERGLPVLMDQDALTEVLGSSVTHFAAIGAAPAQVEYNNLMDVRQNLAGKL